MRAASRLSFADRRPDGHDRHVRPAEFSVSSACEAVVERIDCPVFAQSALNCARPLSVSTWLNNDLMTAGGAVITSAPILAHSSTWMGWRSEAARISVSKP